MGDLVVGSIVGVVLEDKRLEMGPAEFDCSFLYVSPGEPTQERSCSSGLGNKRLC